VLNRQLNTRQDFWQPQSGEEIAAIDAYTGKQWTYSELNKDASGLQPLIRRDGRKGLGLLFARNSYECLVAYIAALKAGTALILSDAALPTSFRTSLLEIYRPNWIFSCQHESTLAGYRQIVSGPPGLFEREAAEGGEIYPELAILLTTSGSTGSPKLVRLTYNNIAANADSILRCLDITHRERAITTLPMSYSYGLSVINSHLLARGTIVFTSESVLRREFWEAVDNYQCTCFAGVPYTYRLLLETGLLKSRGSSLSTVTQAGGKLDNSYIRQLYEISIRRGWRLFVMYGQTEATARICCLPFEQVSQKLGSVGVAVPGGSIAIDQHTGELIYSGPNVMLGYATSREDLARGDELGGILRTGDTARLDSDGYLYITGRLKRFLKVFGKRFNLDEVERILSNILEAPVACLGHDDHLVVVAETGRDRSEVTEVACTTFDLPRAVVRVYTIGTLPRNSNGKLDYPSLAAVDTELSRAAIS
jgi:acyl-CoA synthetase (AMP-forming)/AMP-acid ligase II